MKLTVDLHSHSGYSGGVGQLKVTDIYNAMNLKGIDVFGTGDCLHPKQLEMLKKTFNKNENGLFLYKNGRYFLLQTEVIFTVKLNGYKNKTLAHHLILFPDFKSIDAFVSLMNKWGMKNTIGRPFIVSENQTQLEDRLFEIQNIHPLIEIIPAHVMTPEGILGSRNNLASIQEFYGEFTNNIRVIETGLSADPKMLEKIPDFAELTYISNSDCHSAAYNRIGREFTVLDVEEKSYKGIIEAIRANKVALTAEFNPKEGRFFATGHRANRQGHSNECFIGKTEGLICPICNKKMNMGVEDRTKALSNNNIKPLNRKFLHLIPLIEVVAYAYGVKSVTSKKVVKTYFDICNKIGNETKLWIEEEKQIKESLDSIGIDEKVIKHIISVKNNNFSFNPAGYDGEYGKLKITI